MTLNHSIALQGEVAAFKNTLLDCWRSQTAE